MDPTVEFLRSRVQGLPISPANWAIQMLEAGHQSDALLRLTDHNLHREDQNRLVLEALNDVHRTDLLDQRALRHAYESESQPHWE